MAKTVIWRRLRGTRWTFPVELDTKEYQHLKLALGQRPDVPMPMDIDVMREVSALVGATEPVERERD